MPLPPSSKVGSPQRIVSLQNLIELKSLCLDASKCGAIDTITREVYFKYGDRHTVLRYVRTLLRVVKFKYPAKPVVQREKERSRNVSGHYFRVQVPSCYLYCPTNAAYQLPMS